MRRQDESGWHKTCIKRFFGTTNLPEIKIDNRLMNFLTATKNIGDSNALDIQNKVSLQLVNDKNNSILSCVDYPSEYILKPRLSEDDTLPELEHLVMLMADIAGISTVPHALIKVNDRLAYIAKRYDRRNKARILGMEDFSKYGVRLAEGIYRDLYRHYTKFIEQHSSQVSTDMDEFFIRLVFGFIFGNSDMYLKNFSLIETRYGSDEYVLSPAYDLLPAKYDLPDDNEPSSIFVNGRKLNIRKGDFIKLAEVCGIPQLTAERRISNLVALTPIWIDMCQQSMLPDDLKERLSRLITKRGNVIKRRIRFANFDLY